MELPGVASHHWIATRLAEPWEAPSFGAAGKLNKDVRGARARARNPNLGAGQAVARHRGARAASLSAPRRAQVLEALLDRWVGSVGKLDPHVRLGLVMSLPFLRKPLRESLAPELARLLACAAEDDDPWVRVMARAVGGVAATGRLDLDAVLADVPPVRTHGAAARRARSRARVCAAPTWS
jgi:hypothetical protein